MPAPGPSQVHNTLSRASRLDPGSLNLISQGSELLWTGVHIPGQKNLYAIALGVGPSWGGWPHKFPYVLIPTEALQPAQPLCTPSSLRNLSFLSTCLLAFSLCSLNLETWPQMPWSIKRTPTPQHDTQTSHLTTDLVAFPQKNQRCIKVSG